MKRMKKLLTGLLTLAMTLSMMTMTTFAAEGSGTKMPTIDFGGNKKVRLRFISMNTMDQRDSRNWQC
ncbi:MAG: hypothetical protein ACLSCO_12890 [Gallintestinimicrobium sp.]